MLIARPHKRAAGLFSYITTLELENKTTKLVLAENKTTKLVLAMKIKPSTTFFVAFKAEKKF